MLLGLVYRIMFSDLHMIDMMMKATDELNGRRERMDTRHQGLEIRKRDEKKYRVD